MAELPLTETSGQPASTSAQGRWSTRRRLLFAAKLLLTAALCAWIVRSVDPQSFWHTLRESTLWVLGLVVILRLAGVLISSVKWQQLLAIHDLRYQLWDLMRWFLVAIFVNNFLPTNIGGDGYRIYKTWDNRRGKACAIVAVFVGRATGLAAAILIGYGAATVTYLQTRDPVAGGVVAVVTLGALAAAGVLGAVLGFRLGDRLKTAGLVPQPILHLLGILGDFRRHPRRVVVTGLLSLLFHVNKICVVWLLLSGLGVQVSVFELAVALVAVDLVGLLPITLGGLGLVEGSFIYAMGHFGVSYETGLATMLLWRALLVPVSLLGAFFYFVGDRVPKGLTAGNEEMTTGQYVHSGVK